MTIIERPVRRANVVTGIALIVLPVVALGVKFILPGWLMLVVLFAGILLAAAYVFLVVMAASGFFGPRAAFSFVNPLRARIAGWTHGVSIVLFPFFLTDGGDSVWSSPFIELFQLDRAATVDASDAISFVALLIAVGSYIWLFVEWLIAVRAKRRLV